MSVRNKYLVLKVGHGLVTDDFPETSARQNHLPNFKPHLKYRVQPQGTNFKNYLKSHRVLPSSSSFQTLKNEYNQEQSFSRDQNQSSFDSMDIKNKPFLPPKNKLANDSSLVSLSIQELPARINNSYSSISIG